MVLLPYYYYYTKYFIYIDITNSPLLFNFEILVVFYMVALVERVKTLK